jgi:hypothetical protein
MGSTLIQSLNTLFPTTVIAAILLFLFRELVEIGRKRKAKKRKIGAFKAVLAEEIERNFWAWKQLRRALEYIKQDILEGGHSLYEICQDPAGALTFKVAQENGSSSSHVLAETDKEGFSRILVEAAELDDVLYRAARDAYDQVAEVSHVRSSLINQLAEDNAVMLRGMVEYGVETLDHGLPAIERLYEICTGEKLRKHKLR